MTAMLAAMMGWGMEVSAQQSVTKTDISNYLPLDSVAYAFGVAQTDGLEEYVQQQWNFDVQQHREAFIDGLVKAANIKPNSDEYARIIGSLIGQQVALMMIPGISNELFDRDSTMTLSTEMFMKGMTDVIRKQAAMNNEEASSYAGTRAEAIKQEVLLVKYGDNKKAGEDFLKKMAKKRGVKKLDGGILYKILEDYKEGAHPTESDRVSLHYEGRTIDGNVFDSSFDGDPVTLSLENVIEGFRKAVVNMRVGSTWEVYIPQELAYGAQRNTDIDPFSTLIFKIHLNSIELEGDDVDLDEDEMEEGEDDEVMTEDE